ncbi:MAG: GTP 3',8-cyclase MoaA [Saprospiraceae bacterium]|nr:GTP 3',8-cyclase MoaA [Saprospiraceae bacterium]
MSEATTKRLYDNHGRRINYLRLAVTDRCNLRCFYCMPEEGIDYVPRTELLTYEEMLRLVRLLADHGVTKIRITGGEPFVRKGMMSFLGQLVGIPGIRDVHITTNGSYTADVVGDLKQLGIASVNLSLDTLDKERFLAITRRDLFDNVMQTFDRLVASGIPTKINTVVMSGHNTQDIVPLVGLTRDLPIGVRFIEEMPFNGSGAREVGIPWDHRRILEEIRSAYPTIEKIPDPQFSTSANYRIPGFKGTVGIIAAFSRTFCGTCNRLRVTPQGVLKTCLYDGGIFNIKDLMRQGATDSQVVQALTDALSNRARDGWEAEQRQRQRPVSESMSTIGG